MKPADLIRAALNEELVTEDGEPWDMSLLPGLSLEQIRDFEAEVGFSLPPETRELLEFTNGIENGPLEGLEFTSNEYVSVDEENEFGWMTIGIAADGFGNNWGYVLSKDSTDLGPIYFFCHDAPVYLYQSPDLSHFLTEFFKMCRPPFKSLIHDVHEDRIKEVWLDNPDLIAVEEARKMKDSTVSEFAQTLPNDWKLIDLRNPGIGGGFSWGRCRKFRRHPDAMVFGLDFKEPGRFWRWFRRLTKRKDNESNDPN